MRIKQRMLECLSKVALRKGIVTEEDLYESALNNGKRLLSEQEDFVVNALLAAAVLEKEKRRQADSAGK